MQTRIALYRVAERHHLDAGATRWLLDAAALEVEPPGLAHHLVRGLAVLAAALGGLGLVFWIAANWGSLPRFGQFALLQAVVALMALGAIAAPAARAPLGLLALLGIGGLFAFFGQTYQTGADAWSLFAWWALLALPLCLGARSDVLWAPWVLVAMAAISLWMVAQTGHRWRIEPQDWKVHALGWAAALVVVAGLSASLQRFTGAGPWALRTAVTLALCMVGATAIGSLFMDDAAAAYWLALGLGVATAALVSRPAGFDIFVASGIALTLCTLIVAGLVRLMFSGRSSEPIGALLLIGLVAAGLLAGAVKTILALQRRHGERSAS